MPLLTKSKYLAGLQCSKYLWKLVHEKDKIPEPSKDSLKKMQVGTNIGLLAQKMYPDGIVISSDDFMANIRQTKELLHTGKTLFEAGIMKNNCFSRIDILKPNNDGSFDIIEVKSGTSIKEENIHDVSFQKYCCEMSDIKIANCFLLFINNQYIRDGELDISSLFKIEDISIQVDIAGKGIEKRVEEMFKIINLKEYPDVSIGNHCKTPYECPLTDECWSFLPEHNVFTLYRAGKKSLELFNSGINAIKDIPTGIKLTKAQEVQLRCSDGSTYIDKNALKHFLENLNYPLYYLDFESIQPAIPMFDNSRPYQQICFQYSLHVEDKESNVNHFYFLADGKDDPRISFLKSLKNHLGSSGDIIVYNKSFEITRLKELAQDFPEYAEWVNGILPRIVDLLDPFKNFYYYNSTQKGSASIKKVLPAITGMSYDSLEINNGSDASLLYEEITYTDVEKAYKDKIQQALLEYCKLDTLAELEIIKKMKEIVK
ncbi:MAG: DUF2779 domain-containing protein [Candidatus Woesearchaeota archaeon]